MPLTRIMLIYVYTDYLSKGRARQRHRLFDYFTPSLLLSFIICRNAYNVEKIKYEKNNC
jgi:hypothetical protein